ncbi:GtrA family protein [Streptomyces sp. V4-01]|uniref:GtrA family protein n=1 Tax=Actinacidiphila polyblastidii TaxID=3110430 RepID=A0ABU7P7T9_9ACTN|nr:GtrA family protein [Streptomyces sp. V4-01]
MGRELLGFAVAGGAAYAADLGLFIWLRGSGGLGPLTAKALSFLAGCTVAYLGNALGTYRGRTRASGRARRYGVFFAVNIAGALVQLVCLGFSHYVLGFTAPRDDVVSGLVIGMLLATALRFWGTRTLVFRPAPAGGPAAGAAADPAADPAGPGTADPVAPEAASVRRREEGSRPTWTG